MRHAVLYPAGELICHFIIAGSIRFFFLYKTGVLIECWINSWAGSNTACTVYEWVAILWSAFTFESKSKPFIELKHSTAKVGSV